MSAPSGAPRLQGLRMFVCVSGGSWSWVGSKVAKVLGGSFPATVGSDFSISTVSGKTAVSFSNINIYFCVRKEAAGRCSGGPAGAASGCNCMAGC
jgi:hypothetical protein